MWELALTNKATVTGKPSQNLNFHFHGGHSFLRTLAAPILLRLNMELRSTSILIPFPNFRGTGHLVCVAVEKTHMYPRHLAHTPSPN